jgi:hypothetical protein
MSAFMERANAQCCDVLRARRIAFEQQLVEGIDEDYVEIHIDDDQALQLFIYRRQAGIACGERWIPFEWPDFRSEDELIRRLVEGLEAILDRRGV